MKRPLVPMPIACSQGDPLPSLIAQVRTLTQRAEQAHPRSCEQWEGEPRGEPLGLAVCCRDGDDHDHGRPGFHLSGAVF